MTGKDKVIIGLVIGVALFLGVQLGMVLSDNIFVVLGVMLLIGLIARVAAQAIIKQLK
ncbi:hypothetical protein [Salimicrobium humidisoli]|uniref:hypothetical protein n=1 Tax=Salimicrobium humidisoli TaxID=2029857 RepID=UPI0013042D1D|nr:hypothetical protein [Salimicrobium humidisoli]